MRHIIVLLLTGPLILGCLGSERPSTKPDNSGAGNNLSGNSAPTISGTPSPGIKFGEMYDFEPNAVDADGDALTFDVQNKPNWALFDSATGRLYGQPSLGDIGFYENIIVSVSDGKSSASLPAFYVTVSQSALGAVTLSWVSPTLNSDGSPLHDLAGYNIYYGRASGTYDQVIRIDNPGITTYIVEQLSPATYFFAATAFNVLGVESSLSAEAMKTVD